MKKRYPDSVTVKPLNHDQAQTLVVNLVEESEKKRTHLSTWSMIFKLWAAQFY